MVRIERFLQLPKSAHAETGLETVATTDLLPNPGVKRFYEYH